MAANVTLKDVAKRAGVAWSTASYALNDGPKPVSDDVRTRVLSAAKELGYSSNLMARQLATGRATMLGVMVPQVQTHLTSYQLAGVEEAAHQLGYSLMLSVYRSEIDRALLVQRNMLAHRLDGIICLFETAGSSRNNLDSILHGLAEVNLPFVVTYYDPIENVDADHVLIDHEQGGYLAARYLLEQGRRDVAMVAPMALYSARDRLAGFRRAHREMGVAVREDLMISTGRYLLEEGEEAARKLLAIAPRADAVFSPNDNMAAGVMRELRRAGVQVPDDVAIVGFDDGEWLCDALDPPLTSVHPPILEMGSASVRRLIERLNAPDNWKPHIERLECTLTRRVSA